MKYKSLRAAAIFLWLVFTDRGGGHGPLAPPPPLDPLLSYLINKETFCCDLINIDVMYDPPPPKKKFAYAAVLNVDISELMKRSTLYTMIRSASKTDITTAR